MRRILIFLFLSQCFVMHSQSILKAVVISTESGLPLQNVNVYLKSSYEGAHTNNEGNFMLYIDKINFGDTLVLTHIGFEDIVLSISPNTVLHDTISMNPVSTELEVITITGKKVYDILASCIANYDHNTVTSNMNGEVLQKAYLDDKIIKFFASKFYLKQKKKKIDFFIDEKNLITKISCPDLYRYDNVNSIFRLLSFLNTKDKLRSINENLDFFDKKTAYKNKYSEKDVYVINLEKDLGNTKTTNIKIVIESRNYALIEIELWGDRGTDNEKIRSVETNGVIIANRHPVFSSGQISFRMNREGKWILSKVTSTLTINYVESPNSNQRNLRTNENKFVLDFSNTTNKKHDKGFKKINLKLDLFSQISNKETSCNNEKQINYVLTKEEVEFINEK